MRTALLLALAFLVTAAPSRAGDTNGLIMLLTDYGTEDEYVGVIKGVIYSIFPKARIDTITHGVPKYDVATGAHILKAAAREYPPGTVFLAIVDPGVGTDREPLAIETRDNKYFVGPDNGLLSLAVHETGIKTIRRISNSKLIRPGAASHTFHGRDIFAPAAAHLAAGVKFGKLGDEIKKIAEIEIAVQKIIDAPQKDYPVSTPAPSSAQAKPEKKIKVDPWSTVIDLTLLEVDPYIMKRFDTNKDGNLSKEEIYTYLNWREERPDLSFKKRPYLRYFVVREGRVIYQLYPPPRPTNPPPSPMRRRRPKSIPQPEK